jgi:hypothetical protein
MSATGAGGAEAVLLVERGVGLQNRRGTDPVLDIDAAAALLEPRHPPGWGLERMYEFFTSTLQLPSAPDDEWS